MAGWRTSRTRALPQGADSTAGRSLSRFWQWALIQAIVVICTTTGCHRWRVPEHMVEPPIPHELANTSLPRYVIAPPDILLIDAIQLVPKPPYRIAPFDVLIVQSSQTFPKEPIEGPYIVEPDGTINLAYSYGSVQVARLTLPEARKAIAVHLKARFKIEPEVTVALAQSRAMQQVRGEHLVRPDGTVGLGVYGSVHVAGLTLDETRAIIEAYLSEFFVDPEVSIDVLAYNSRAYYVITDGAGQGEQVLRFPVTGSETVLDAVSKVNGLSPVSSRHRVWLVRPASPHEGDQVFAVDWKGITRRGRPETNYQLFPGDRVYIGGAPLVTFDTYLARVISPMERIFGVTLLGNATVQSLRNKGDGSGVFGF
jgi:polysaccharide export outer membrane protein